MDPRSDDALPADVVYAECSGKGSKGACLRTGYANWGEVNYEMFRTRYEAEWRMASRGGEGATLAEIVGEEAMTLMVWEKSPTDPLGEGTN